jgi:hypothetical protein
MRNKKYHSVNEKQSKKYHTVNENQLIPHCKWKTKKISYCKWKTKNTTL